MHSLRYLLRNKGYVIITLTGFATGLTACLMLVSYLTYQAGFDSFHIKRDRIYRGQAVIQLAGRENTTIHLPGLIGEVARQELPGIESFVRLNSDLRHEIRCAEKKFTDLKLFYTDSAFFDVFTFPLLRGDPEVVLTAPYSVVLTRNTAKNLFGEVDIIGKELKVNDYPYTVTGVMEDLPGNSHIAFDMLCSLNSFIRADYNIIEREGFSFPTYFLLAEGVHPKDLYEGLNKVFDRVVSQKYGSSGITGELTLQPLSAIHTTQLQATDYAQTTPRGTLILFAVLAVFILLVAVINFVNLTTALYEGRSREIGIKKVLGATRTQLFWQTMRETALLVITALIISLVMCELVAGWAQARWSLTIPLFYKTSLPWMVAMLAGTALVIVLSSAYPNWYLSRLSPGAILREESLNRSRRFSLAKILVLVQYGLSVFIIILMFLFSAQMKHVTRADLGFDKEDIVVYENLTNEVVARYSSLKNRLEQFPSVVKVTASYSIPGKHRIANSVVYRSSSPESSGIIINVNRVQHDYLKTYGIRLVEGEDFSPLRDRDSTSYLINQEAVEKLGLENPIGERLVLRGVPGTVIGVFANFRTIPLYSGFDKEILTMQSDLFNFISIRMTPGYGEQDRKNIEAVFREFDPGYEPDFLYLEELYSSFYEREENQLRLIIIGAVVGIILSVMGLISLVALSLRKQRREIGIRKVFGATGDSVFVLLISRSIRWVVYSNLLAWPLAYLVAGKWLERFAYRIRIIEEWPLFFLAGFLVVLLTFLSISLQSLRVSRMSPAEVIRRN